MRPAVTRPEIVFAWRPAAERASNADAGGFEALILIGLAIQHYGRIVIGGCAHAPVIRALKGFARGERVHAVLSLSVAQSFPWTMLPLRRSRPSILDNTRASNANASLSCWCTVFVMTNRTGMSGADLSPRSDIERSTAWRLDSRFDIGMAGKK